MKLSSFQVVDKAGCRDRSFRLPGKRDFRRAPWIIRQFRWFIAGRENHIQRNTASNKDGIGCSPRDILEASHEHVAQMELDKIGGISGPPLTYQDSIKPLISALASDNDKAHRFLHMFSKMVTMLVTCSAEFLSRAARLPEKHLLPSPKDHYRALTNYWVYLIVGTILHDEDDPVIFDPDIYAYSFLYPHTDDLLDSSQSNGSTQGRPPPESKPEGSEDAWRQNWKQSKNSFVANIAKHISTGKTPTKLAFAECQDRQICKREERVYELLDELLLPSTIAHASVPSSSCMRESLLAVNAAQLASLNQRVAFQDMRAGVRSLSKLDKKTIFDITVNKGVAAVMPNAYLHSPNGITKEQAELVATIGYMGQIINDIEGLYEDLEEKSLTPALISYLKHNGNLDRFVERCLTHLSVLNRRAPRLFSTLPLDRVQMILGILHFRLLITTALLHDNHVNEGGDEVVSPRFIRAIESFFRSAGGSNAISFSLLAELGRLEQQLFGGGDGSSHNHLSTPEEFRCFVLASIKELEAVL